MPRISKRQAALATWSRSLRTSIIIYGLQMNKFLSTGTVTIGTLRLPYALTYILMFLIKLEKEGSMRYLPGIHRHYSVPKSRTWLHTVLPMYDAARRSAFIRVNDTVFEALVSLSRRYGGQIFRKRRGPAPHSLRLQLAIGLTRIGSYGNAASTGRVAALFGVSERSVTKSTSRTILLLNKVAPMLIKWPGQDRRRELSEYAGDSFGFYGSIGSTDGTTIPLFKAPSITPWAFFDRKSRYSLHALVTVDHEYRVIDIVVNYLGPAPDSVVQREATWQRFPETFLAEDEYFLGDKGMLLSVQCIIPYKGELATTNDNANFITQLARLRIVAEQVIGQVKSRFSSLKELRIQIEDMQDVVRGGQWIIAAFTLHNLCLKYNDYRRPSDKNCCRTNQPCSDSIQPYEQSSAETKRKQVKGDVVHEGLWVRGHNRYWCRARARDRRPVAVSHVTGGP